MDKYGVKSTHDSIKNKLIDYINTVYLGKNDALRDACEEKIVSKGVLYQEPFIEANPAYLAIDNGIANSNILSDDAKLILGKMIEKKLGVYKAPYSHQIEALEVFHSGKDLFVATGTGSGKTECFMWPVASKIALEQMKSPETWSQRGVRAIMLYPMNALVSDQLGRLRKMIGNREDGFHSLSEEIAFGSRVPQFGMYTGRTPYPGETSENQNKELAETLEKDLLSQSKEVKAELVKLGKFPTKKDLSAFINRLKNSEPILTDPEDGELITRHEMIQNCPDILITNYSMLEYMLLRPIENSIWDRTKEWLNSSPDNKLLFVIDEAHMYRGSAGGEVALLIRRVLHKLGIDRNRVQFILTSASVPDEDEKVKKFACDLSAQDFDKCSFELIRGKQEDVKLDGKEFDPQKLFDYDIDALLLDRDKKILAIKEFARIVGIDENCDFNDDKAIEIWLYHSLLAINPVLRIMKQTRGNATRFSDVAKIAFPNVNQEVAEKATSVLLAIAPLAKNENDSVLYPARLHMMFRGLQGIYACSNPSCNDINHDGSLGFGKVFLNRPSMRCKCGGMIYELLNDRACGALFFKGYIDTKEANSPFVWNEPGNLFSDSFKEKHFFVISDDNEFRKVKGTKIAWMNSLSGKLDLYNEHDGEENYIKLAYSDAEIAGRPNVLTFKSCPKCEKNHFVATDFITKGNEPFFNLVSEQFYVQPPVQDYLDKPNQGRKVLLFSDSRQRAAILARDLTRAADEDAMKKALTVAAFELQKWADKENERATLDLLYVFFLKVAYENNLRFFYGNNEEDLLSALNEMGEQIKKKGSDLKYKRLAVRFFSHKPDQYSEHLLRQLCNYFRSLTDVGLCWIEPCDDDDVIEDVVDLFDDNSIPMSIDEFKILFAAWAMEIMTSEYAVGSDIDDSVRREITSYHQRLGLEDDNIIPSRIRKRLEEKGFSKDNIAIIAKALSFYLAVGNNSTTKYLNMSLITLKYGENHDWYKCSRCGGVFPFALWGKCAHCGRETVHIMSQKEFEGIDFWRKPVISAVHGDPQALMTRINTEEHTAQLSHKDQRQKTWSTTEDYEMRFQNVHVDNDRPVDVLSCTTTMEVGIDIGSLTAVGLRNIPPTRENYQQRAGRAGRRSAAISTIVTFTDNRPHDSFYFHNPDAIISGTPRTPWIDNKNEKLSYRHFNVICTTEFFEDIGLGANNVGICDFVNNMYDDFIEFIKSLRENDFDMTSLVPKDVEFDFSAFKDLFVSQLAKLKSLVEEFPEEYRNDDSSEKSVLDAFLESGIFPTYSFPKDVVGFFVEDRYGKEIQQKPERSLETAISEYAPGRVVVINKNTYVSGGVYSFHSKFRADQSEHPAQAYFENADYFKPVYLCNDNACNWMGLEPQANCPFCGKNSIEEQYMLKPWGFAPINGRSSKVVNVEAEVTYAEEPCYSLTPKEEEMVVAESFKYLRYTRRSNDPLLILNKGPHSTGFTICRDCGAAVPGNDDAALHKLMKPFVHPYKKFNCAHSPERIVNTYLGNQFRTDMVVYELALDSDLINVDPRGMWIRRAGQTLAEAMTIAGGRLLEIEFNEIKSGYRLRYDNEQNITYVDVFLFDGLSSGAGYCSELANRTEEFFKYTRDVLNECPSQCDSACHECLMHYWNQRVHNQLDRFAALQLLDWCEFGKLPEEISFDKQSHLLYPLNGLGGDYSVDGDGINHYVTADGKKMKIVAYPAMWNYKNGMLPKDVLPISDNVLKYALPKSDEIIRLWLSKR